MSNIKIPFSIALKKYNRNIVIHHTHILKQSILNCIFPTDILFFDDCVVSQYDFIVENIEILKDNLIVIGFSSNIYKDSNNPSIVEQTSILHERYHNGDFKAKDGFMTIDQIKQLNQLDNCYVASHGFNHLDLRNEKNRFTRYSIFANDFFNSVIFLKKLELQSNIFIYPYDYVVPMTEKLVKSYGYNYIYPKKENTRIYIEELLNASN